MKIEWAKNKKIPFSKLEAGQCFLYDEDDVCLACEDSWAVVLATGEMFELDNPDCEMVTPIAAKVVVLEVN